MRLGPRSVYLDAIEHPGARDYVRAFHTRLTESWACCRLALVGYAIMHDVLQQAQAGSDSPASEGFDLLMAASALGDAGRPFGDELFSIFSSVDIRALLAVHGRSWDLQLQGFIAQIYDYWDRFTRPGIELDLNLSSEDTQHGFFGDLRQLRNAIAHDGGVLTPKVCNALEVVDWYEPGNHVTMTLDQAKRFEGMFPLEWLIALVGGAPLFEDEVES